MSDSKKLSELTQYIETLQSEYIEFKEQSKEYEQTLEQELADAESRLEKSFSRIEHLESELSLLKEKYLKDEAEIVRLNKEKDSLKATLKKFEDQKRELEHLNDQWENSTRVLEYSNKDLEERLYQAEESVIMYKEELSEVSNIKEAEMQRLRDEVKDLKQELSVLVLQHGDANKISELEQQLKKAIHDRNQLENQVGKDQLEKTSCCTVAVFVKVRPILPMDNQKAIGVMSTDTSITILPPKDKTKSVQPRTFEFEKVFGTKDPLDSIFNELLTSIQHFAMGGSCCVMSYGQTGSGKTFTMSGLISKTLDLLASLLSNDAKISLHCIEVYNEQVRNLLSDSQLSKNWKDIVTISQINLGGDWHSSVKRLINVAASKRSTKSTECNEYSSRSHCIYTLYLHMLGRKSVMQFVDLAGSERISKSSVTGDTLKEALHINKSLSALQDVIAALESKSAHVPYRNSLLTRILKLSLSTGESKVSVILNCSPTEDSINETISTLTLGIRLKSIDLSWAIRKNLKTEEVERTLNLLEKERTAKNALARKLEKLERDVEGYGAILKEKDSKINMLLSKVKQYEKGYGDQIESLKKELATATAKNDAISKKFVIAKSKIDSQKLDKQKGSRLLKKDIKITKLGCSTPIDRKDSVINSTFLRPPVSSRIPKIGSTSCNTSKINIVL